MLKKTVGIISNKHVAMGKLAQQLELNRRVNMCSTSSGKDHRESSMQSLQKKALLPTCVKSMFRGSSPWACAMGQATKTNEHMTDRQKGLYDNSFQ